MNLSLLAIAVLVIVLFYPALPGSFLHDDYSNIYNNKNVHISELSWESLKQSFVSIKTNVYSLYSRPISRITFALNYYFSGLDPYWYKVTNLFIHLLVGYVLFTALRLLLQAQHLAQRASQATSQNVVGGMHTHIALLATLVWLIHPLNVSTVMYVVQRMAQMSMLFMLIGLVFYLKCRLDQLQGRKGHGYLWAAILLVWPLAIFSKENAVIFPLLCLLTEIVALRFVAISRLVKWLYVTLVLVITSLAAYLIYDPSFFEGGYRLRDFTMLERLMTQLRMFWLYISSIVIPSIGGMGLYLDFIPISKGLLQPATTLVSLIGVVLFIVLAIILRNIRPLISFGLLWFLLGHLIESTVIGLEIAYEHRNYLPSAGLIFAAMVLMAEIYSRSLKLRKLLPALLTVLVILLAYLTFVRSEQWSSEFRLVAEEADRHPRSYRANVELARTFIIYQKYDKAWEAIQAALAAERPYANVYITIMSLEHIRKGELSKEMFNEMITAFEKNRIYISILSQMKFYITDASRNRWEGPEQLLLMVEALLKNPYLQADHNQGVLHLLIAKLYSDMRNMEMLKYHAKKAYSLVPQHVSIAKVYAHVLQVEGKLDEARDVVVNMLESTASSTERKDYMKMYKSITGKEYIER